MQKGKWEGKKNRSCKESNRRGRKLKEKGREEEKLKSDVNEREKKDHVKRVIIGVGNERE